MLLGTNADEDVRHRATVLAMMQPPRAPVDRITHAVLSATYFNGRASLEWAEGMGGLALMLAWGFWLLLPLHTFDGGAAYREMALIAPEWVWGAVFLVAGFGEVVAVAFHNLSARRLFATLNLFCWVVIAATIWVGNPASTGAPLYTIISVASFNISRRLWS